MRETGGRGGGRMSYNTYPGGGVLIIFLGGVVPPGPENPYPVSDLTLKSVYPISDPVMCGKFGNFH